MAIYFTLAIMLLVGSCFNEGLCLRTTPLLERNKSSVRGEKLYYFLCCSFMVAIVAFRADFWTDQYGYTYIFNAVSDRSFFELISSGTRYTNGNDYLFYLFTKIISMITDDVHVYFGIIALITYIPIFYIIAKYSKAPFFSLLFIFTTGFFFSSFNVIRSCMVYGLSTLLIRSLKERKLLLYIVCITFLSLLHSSAILLIPVYFIVRIPLLDKKHFLITLTCLIIFYVGFGYLFALAVRLLVGGLYATQYSGINTTGGSLGMIIPSVFVLVLMLSMLKCINWNNHEERILANGTLIWCAMGISVMAMRLMTRFSDMMFIFPALFVPRLVMKLRPRNKDGITVQRTTIFLLMSILLILRLVQTMSDSPFNPYYTYLEEVFLLFR